MQIFDTLKEVGLKESEVEVYLYLLEHGLASPPEISRATHIARSNLHHVLNNLVNENLVKKQRKGKRFVYIPTPPSSTLHILDQKRERLENALDELESLYKKQKNKPVIKFYEGEKELAQIFDDALTATTKEILGFASTNKLFEAMPSYNWHKWQRELKRRGIFLRDILSSASREVAEETHVNARPFQDYKLLNSKYGDTATDILVWDNKVAVMTLEAPVFGTVIENESLANTYRIQFDIMWRALPRVHTTS